MFDSIQDFNEFILLIVVLVVTTGYIDRKTRQWLRRKRRRQYRNLTRPGRVTHHASDETGNEPQ